MQRLKFVEKLYANLKNKSIVKGAHNALLVAAYLNRPDLVYKLLKKVPWFNSDEYELLFYNLIEHRPKMHEILKQYKKDISKKILEITELIPDIANIIAEYKSLY